MNENELTRLYQSLTKILEAHNLSWVIDQVNEQVLLGKTEEIEILDDRQLLLFEANARNRRRRKKERASFLKTREYFEKEKVLLLIDAIEQSVINTGLMIYDVIEYFDKEAGVRTVAFYSEGYEKIFVTDDLNIFFIWKLKKLLDQLRSQINAY